MLNKWVYEVVDLCLCSINYLLFGNFNLMMNWCSHCYLKWLIKWFSLILYLCDANGGLFHFVRAYRFMKHKSYYNFEVHYHLIQIMLFIILYICVYLWYLISQKVKVLLKPSWKYHFQWLCRVNCFHAPASWEDMIIKFAYSFISAYLFLELFIYLEKIPPNSGFTFWIRVNSF